MSGHPVDTHVGNKLRLFREQAGLTQKGLAASIDVSFQQLQKYETAANRVSASKLWALCMQLRVQPNDFFDGLKGVKSKKPETVITDGRNTRAVLDLHRAFLEISDIDARRKLLAIARTLARLDKSAEDGPHPVDHADIKSGTRKKRR